MLIMCTYIDTYTAFHLLGDFSTICAIDPMRYPSILTIPNKLANNGSYIYYKYIFHTNYGA